MAADRHTPNLDFREPDGSIVPHAALYMIQFVALAAPPFRGRRFLFSTLIVGLAIQAHLNPHFTNTVPLAQPFTIAWSYYMATLAKLLFADAPGPEASYWRLDKSESKSESKSKSGAKEKEALKYAGFGWRKLVWAVGLVTNQRGVGWNFQVKNVPPVPKEQQSSRSKFLVAQAVQFVKCMVVADVLFQLWRRLFYTGPDGRVGQMNSKYLSLHHEQYGWSFLKALVFGSTPYFMLSMQYAQIAFVAVLLGISGPEDWPSPFGTLRETTTVRDFWGKFWHQQLRYMLTQYTEAFTRFLRIPKGTNLSSYTKLYLAFFISGFFHAFSQLQMPSPANITSNERTVGFFLFFVWQVGAITVEDFAQWLVRKVGSEGMKREGTRGRRWLGWAWVTLVMWKGLPLVADTFLRLRMGIDPPFPNSVSEGFVKRWVPVPP